MAGAIHSTKMEKQKPQVEKNKENPCQFYYHFLYKAFIVAIFLVILPFFPSQAPEFINQSLLTRNWELLHLLFVGIAISYGLFSRRNDETEKEKENSSKFDNANLVVSRFLQLSSFFEDENETSSSESDETQFQTWKVQYYRNKPEIVVASHHSNFDERSATSSRIGEKPLLLPVRSLKSRVSAADPNVSSPTTKSGSKRSSSNSNKARDGSELEGSGCSKVEDEVKENLVLPSPIPWRSSLSMDHHESEFSKLESRSIKSQKSRSSQPSSISPSPSFSSESLAKSAEDLMRKKSFYKSCPPPPPPPPPTFQKSISMKPPRSSNSFDKGASFDKELKRSFTSERNELKGWSIGDNLMGRVDSEIEVKPKGQVENLSMGKSVRTVRGEGMNGRIEKSQLDSEEHYVEEPTRKALGYDHMSFSVPLVSEPALEEEKESFIDKLIVESDEDTETEDEEVGGTLIQKDTGESSITNRPSSSNVNGDEGPDVDKKADEFIAKFREQIRLQRIESIKRSARIATRNSSR
ncbi:uncharacterized protein LOC133311278 [Gastrolobium bilobum]|uniref:uncharacterized protein LOC133311278 n=1 Tax=Gastrolobium bilobum TaxID=150636 RepID=UPI002AB139C4|nr:uncharacterized protein LOC133311278 [Gastrolobium bilobum]